MKRSPVFFKNLLFLINLGVIILYLATCLVPYINTDKAWYIAFPGLVFPLIFFALVAFIILWTFWKSRLAWVSIVVLLIGFQQIRAVFAFHFPQKFIVEKPENTLRILQWNLTSWDVDYPENSENSRSEMLKLVKKQNADILCFQEFFEAVDTLKFPSNISAVKSMGYPYYYFGSGSTLDNAFYMGTAIFSKFPILNTERFTYAKDARAEPLIYADIQYKDTILRVFTAHLQSVNFVLADYRSLSKIKRGNEDGFKHSRTIISKLKTGYEYRYEQAGLVEEKISQSPYPAIICGDFNDVPNSSTYFKIKGDLQDTFLKEGFFLGRTFRFISPTLRIDYILVDDIFEVTQFLVIHVPYSQHFPIVADLKL